jgi:hypothetical protein
MSAAYLFSGAKYPSKVFDSLDAATTWLAPRVEGARGAAFDRREMERVLEGLVQTAKRV